MKLNPYFRGIILNFNIFRLVVNRWLFSSFLVGISVLNTACSDSNQNKSEQNAEATLHVQSSFQEDKSKFNIFLIVSDSLRPDVLGCYGGAAHTPNIDRLAESGALFENAYSTSPWTAPSSVAIFTGNNPGTYPYYPYEKSIRIGVPDREVLFPEVLTNLGYKSKMIIDNPHAGLHNNLQGVSNIGFRRDRPIEQVLGPDRLREISAIVKEEPPPWPEYRSAYVWSDELLAIPKDQPFFFIEWFLDPHSPYDPAQKFRQRIEVDPTKLPKPLTVYSNPLPLQDKQFSDNELKYNKELYLAEVESIDERVGIIVETMKAKGVLDRTYVIFTADHGEQFGEHGKSGHGAFGKDADFYEVLLRVPLIIAGPGVGKKVRPTEAVSLIGLMPTLKSLLKVEYSMNAQGESFAGLLFGQPYVEKPLYFSSVNSTQSQDALLDEGHKIIMREGATDLFDIKKDPNERLNIAGQNPERLATLSKKIMKIRAENSARLDLNRRAPSTNLQQSKDEHKKTIKTLKELGYMK